MSRIALHRAIRIVVLASLALIVLPGTANATHAWNGNTDRTQHFLSTNVPSNQDFAKGYGYYPHATPFGNCQGMKSLNVTSDRFGRNVSGSITKS